MFGAKQKRIDELEQQLEAAEAANDLLLRKIAKAGRRRFLVQVPPQERAKLVENLSCPVDNPQFQAVLSVIRGMQRSSVLNVSDPSLERFDPKSERMLPIKPNFYDGALAMAVDVEERLLELNEEGRKKKAG